ncbi:hypothetical protein JCM10213_001048 [Rhodosporidiobolus nylandii]
MALNVVHWFGAFLLFAAMALLVVASVSSPIWDNVGYLHGHINGQSFTMGNWGYCAAGSCSSAKLGYDRNFLSSLVGNSGAGASVVHGLSVALILTPICAGLSALALLFALSTHLVMGILASLLSLLALVATVVSLGLDLGLFLTARQRINNNIPNSHATVGSCIWLVVAACGCQLVACLTVCFTRSRRRRAAEDREFAAVPAMRATSTDTRYVAPSTVGSTTPMTNYAAEPGVVAEPGVPPTGPTTTSATKGHFWQRNSNATETY